VIVWADDAEACARDLEGRFPEHDVLVLDVSTTGAL
jgi:hypothetical protein